MGGFCDGQDDRKGEEGKKKAGRLRGRERKGKVQGREKGTVPTMDQRRHTVSICPERNVFFFFFGTLGPCLCFCCSLNWRPIELIYPPV